MLVELWVDGSTPYRGLVIWECGADVIDALCGGNDTGDMDMLGSAMGKECFVSEFHRTASGEHGVGDDKYFAVERWGGEIFHMYANLGVGFVLVGAICACEGIFSLIEHAQYAVVHR